MQSLIVFFNHPFFIIVGGLATLSMIIVFFYTVYLVIKGVLPVWYRLGLGLSRRRIAIFGSLESYESIKSSLTDSEIFRDDNIVHIGQDNIDKAKDEPLFLVDWESFRDDM